MTEHRTFSALADDERFRPGAVLGPAALFDAGLPLVLFTGVYALGGRNLAISLWVAVGSAVVIAVVRVLRRDPVQNAVAGLIGVGIAALLAARTGRAEDVFAPGLLINAGYGLAFLISILVRWPLLGLFVGFATGQGTSWRRDLALLRAYTWASALWAAMFAARLAVQLPLWLAGEDQLGWLAAARLVMSWPLFLLVAYLSWLIVRPAHRAHSAQMSAAGRGVR